MPSLGDATDGIKQMPHGPSGCQTSTLQTKLKMRLSSLIFTALGLALAAAAATVPEKRQVILAPSGTTVAPSDGSTIATGSEFPFEYQPTNYCHSGYSPISVYLSTAAPTSADITGGGELAEGSFVFKFGDYLYANFGA